jgi:3-hydroxyisobutyrate dehydrogenase
MPKITDSGERVAVRSDRRPADEGRPIRVGVVGLGNMGGPVARNIIEAGYPVVVSDRDESRKREFVALGAESGELDDVANVDVVLLFLPGPKEVTEVGGWLVERMRPGSALVNLSTSAPETVQALAVTGGGRGVAVVDSPVTGAADGARAGALTLMVGADARDLETVRPVLETFSQRILHVGGVGSGTVVKLLTNMLWFTHIAALCDAMAIGVKSGVDPSKLASVVPHTAGGSWAAEHDLPNIVSGHDDPSFTLALCAKDIGLISDLARKLAVPIPISEVVFERFREARGRFGDSAGELAVARVVEQAAEVSIRDLGGAD